MALKGPDFHQLPHPVEKILKVVGMLLLVNKLMSMHVDYFFSIYTVVLELQVNVKNVNNMYS